VANDLLPTPDTDDIYSQGVADISRLSLPGFPGSSVSTSSASSSPSTPAPNTAPSASRSPPTRDDIINLAKQYDVDPNFALNIFHLESSGNWNSKDSSKGAVGGMQVMPGTYKMMMGTDAGQRDPWNNATAAMRYIAYGQKTLGTRDPALLAAGYQAGYDRKDLKQGIIPNTTDGGMTTQAYAARIAGGMGLTGASSVNPNSTVNTATATQAQSTQKDANQYKPLTLDSLKNLPDSDLSNLFGTQADLDAKYGTGRYKAFTPQEFRKLPDSSIENLLNGGPPGILATVNDAALMGSGGVYKGLGQALRGVGEAVSTLGDYTTTPVVNYIFGTHNKTQNLLGPAADLVGNFAQKVQSGVSQTTQDAMKGSEPGGQLLHPSTWTLGRNPSVRGYAMMGMDVLGSAAPIIMASYATGGSATAGAVAGGLQGGGGAAEQARTAIMQMKQQGTLAKNSSYYQHLIDTGVKPDDAAQQTADAAERWAFMLNAPIAMAGGAISSKLMHPATAIADTLPWAGRVAARTAASSADMGVQNAGGQVATNVGINQAAGTKIDPTEGVVGAAVSGIVGGAPLGIAGAAFSSRRAATEMPSSEQAPAGGTSSAAPPGVEAAPTPTQSTPKAPQPESSGPIGRAIERAATTQPAREANAPSGNDVVIGDDGHPYRITSGENGLTFEPVEHAETPASPAEKTPQPTETASIPEQQTTSTEQTAAPEQFQETDATQATAAKSTPEAAPAKPETTPETKAAVAQAPAARDESPATRPLTEWSDGELRNRLRYLTQQSKLNGGWSKLLTTERGKVSTEINRRNDGAPVPDNPDMAAPVVDHSGDTNSPQAEAQKTESGAYLDIGDANRAALHMAEQTDKVHVVTPRDENGRTVFDVKPQEETNAVSAARDSSKVDLGEQASESVPATSSHLDQSSRTGTKDDSIGRVRSNEMPAHATGERVSDRGSKQFRDEIDNNTSLPKLDKELAGATPRYAFGKKQFEPEFANDIDRAAYITAQKNHSPRDADYLKFVADATGMSDAQVREHGARVREAIKGIARDAEPGKLKVPNFYGTEAGNTTVPDVADGKWFGSREKAKSFIERKNLGDTHDIVQTGKVRFEIKPKLPEGMERFPSDSGTLGIPREQMPQVSAASHGGLVNHLNAQGIEHETKNVPSEELKPTQAEFSPDGVERAKDETGDRAVIVSNDGHIIDGHHQVLAAQEDGKNVKAIVLDAPIDQALEAVQNSPSAKRTEVAETSNITKESHSGTIASKEGANDRSATARPSDEGVPEQGPRRLSPDAGGRVAEDVDGQPGRNDAGRDRTGETKRREQSGVDEQPNVRSTPTVPDKSDQRSREVGGRDSGSASDRDNRGPATRVGTDYRIEPGALKRTGSWRSTAEQNVGIVELVKQLEQSGRRPTPEEAALLTKFTGWGASEIANGIFPNQYGRYKDSTWQALGERLKASLTPAEYEQAKRTTQYAHYTSEGVIRSIYKGLERLGFAGGKVLEPGMGVGLFRGLMPDGMAKNSQYTGVEYDGLTGAIAKLLYPQSNIIVGDYTKTPLPRDFFDSAIGNPPFSATTITNDPEYKKNGFMLHDYFFAKTLDRVKPGGTLVFVTSKGTMDKVSDRARRYLSDRANLLGAVRLPQTAFKDNAGTEVVTDVLFLQKRGDGVPENGVKWLDTADVQTPQGPAQINQYFAAHPEMVLGEHALTGSMYRANEYTVLPRSDIDMDEAFAKAIDNLPQGVYQPGARNPAASKAIAFDRDFSPMNKKEGGLYVGDNGRLMQVENGSGIDLDYRRGADGKQIALKPADKAFLKSWVGLRNALKQTQMDQLSDGDWQQSLKALSSAYDAFVDKHGNLLTYSTITRKLDDGTITESKRFKNDPLLRLDVEGALAYSLEHIKENGAIVKAPVLSERVLQAPREPEIKTTNDALFVSLNNKGSLDLDDVARLSNLTREGVIHELGTAIYEDPSKGWQTVDAYLSGNVVRKLNEVQAAARTDKRFARNVDALLAVQPKPLGPSEITVKLGQNWIHANDIAAFAKEALNENIDVGYNQRLGTWSASQRGSNYSEFNTPKLNAGQILDSVLNNRQLKVTFRDNEGKTHVDAEATEKANDVAQKMHAAFNRWIWSDTNRADRLVNHYNDNFNNIAPRQFDGSHLTLPGVTSRIELRPNQKRAIWRAIQEGDTYLAHAVGSGKTYTMIAAGMEERRLGLSKKPLYAVPNHMLSQFAREFLELYPAANIMVADEQNFHTHNRRRFVAQAALNNPDAIIVTHSAFGRMGMSDEYASKYISDQIDEWKSALEDTDKSDRLTRKQIERRIEQLERRLEGKQGANKDKVLSFEELGVDRLFVDELHEFRKLAFATNQSSIKGIDPDGSQRALDLAMKVQYLRDKNPGRAIVGASGTPITNTMGELYTAQRLFQPHQLAEDGLESFDSWANQYGDIVAGFEQNAAGGYEVVSRFAKFQNVPELMRRVRSFMDILTSKQLSQYVDRPEIEGGARQVEVTPSPSGYKEYQQALEQRIQAIRQRKGPPKKGDDIILKVIADGRFSAIDMRFVDPTTPSDPNSKLNQMLDAVSKDYHAASDYEYTTNGKVDPIKGASHIIFTDIGLGEQSAANRGFDMKSWIEKRLVDAGVKREHIAFMRDNKEHAKKERLFADLREGKKRILIGGKDMETGVNVQKRLYTLEHLDAPWFPASIEQREGRIERQGNQNKAVRVRAWATKGSYDSTMWGMNARKARFIEQALSGDDSVRSLEDVSEASAFDMAAALASGDERYMRLAGLKSDVERLERLSSAHHDEQNKLRRDKNWAETQIERDSQYSAQLQDAIKKRTPIRAGEFLAKVGKKDFDNRDEFSKTIFERFKSLASKESNTAEQIGEIGGFPIMYHGLPLKGSGEYAASVTIDLPGDPSPLLSLPLDPDLPVGGIATRAANQVNSLDRGLSEAKDRITQNKRRIEQIGKRLGAPFSEQPELLDKLSQLNDLESQLTSEKAAENAPAPSSDAALATLQTEGEKVKKQTYNPESENPDTQYSVKDDDITVRPTDEAMEELRNQEPLEIRSTADQRNVVTKDLRKQIYEDLLNKKESDPTLAEHHSLGVISANHKGLSKSFANAIDRAKVLSLTHLNDLLGQGTYLGSTHAQKGKPDIIEGYHYIGRRVNVDGVPLTALAVLEQKHGKINYYNHTMMKDVPGAKSLAPEVVDGEIAAYRRPVFNPTERISRQEAAQASHPEIMKTLTSGPLGTVIERLIHSGRINLRPKETALPRNATARGTVVQGHTDEYGRIWLATENLTHQTALPVLMHEVFHARGRHLLNSPRWQNLMSHLQRYYESAQKRRDGGLAKDGNFWDEALRRVDRATVAGVVDPSRAVEEFGAYAIENHELAPNGIKKWVDNLIGVVKEYLARRFGVQLGEVTPAQLRAFAVEALRDRNFVRPPVSGAIGGMPINGGPMSIADNTRGDGVSSEPRYSVADDKKPGLTPDDPSFFEKEQAKRQNDMNRVKKVQERIKKLTGKEDLGFSDYYRAETNRPGRIAARLEDAEKTLTGPLMADLAKSGYKQAQLEELLHAQHAEERNAKIAEINPDMPDGGSGMTNAEAQDILDKYQDAPKLQALAQKARDISKATLDLKLAYGLIDQNTHDTLTSGYENYVPLKGALEGGAKIRRAMGHDEREEHILSNIARDYGQAVRVGEKNIARQSLLGLVAENPDPDLWTIGVPPRGRRIAGQVYTVKRRGTELGQFDSLAEARSYIEGNTQSKNGSITDYSVEDSKGERVQEFVKPLQDNEVMVYVKGQPVRIQIKDEALAAQVRRLTPEQTNAAVSILRGAIRYFSRIYTGYSPAFILRNAARDALTGSINIIGNEGATTAAKSWARYPSALKALGQYSATGKIPEGETGRYLKEYRDNGGKTGASWMSDLDAHGKKLERMYDDAYGAKGYLKEGRNVKAAIIAGRKILHSMAHVVEIGNQATENALRLSLYMTLRDQGVKPGTAAQAAKNVTVDFDRKGTSTGWMGATWLFFNPAVQGTANGLHTIFRGKHREQAWAALGMLTVMGVGVALSGLDDDKDRWLGQSWDTRSRNLIFKIGNHTLRVPLSQEFSPAYGFGVAMAEAMRGGKATTTAANIVSSFLDAYFPMSGVYNPDSKTHILDAIDAVFPTIGKPLLEIGTNHNIFGSKIVPDNISTQGLPDNMKMNRGTKGTLYDKAAQGIASFGELLGARPYENDVTKVSPETLKYLWQTYTGGLGKFVTDSIGVAGMAATDPGDISSKDVPIVSDFWRPNDISPIRSRFYDLKNEVDQAQNEFKAAEKAADEKAMQDIYARPGQAVLLASTKLFKQFSQAVGAIRNEAVMVNADDTLTASAKRAKLKELEKQEEQLERSAIDAFTQQQNSQ
jgi:N12 class adenine-specific DNA methylase